MRYRLLVSGLVGGIVVVGVVWAFVQERQFASILGFHLAMGWWLFPRRVFPAVSFDPWALATGAICVVLLAAGLHSFLSWLQASLGSPDGETDGGRQSPWRFRWTASILTLIVLAFAIGICGVGIAHQIGWLVTDPHPLVARKKEKAVTPFVPPRHETGSKG